MERRFSKILKATFTFTLISLSNGSLSADNLGLTSYFVQDVLGRLTPQTSGLLQIGDASSNLFSGNLSVGIPLYTIEDEDFTIPISLQYVSDGFKPRQHSEYVGQNWSLQAGGCVSRTVQNLPDDFESAELHGDFNDYSFNNGTFTNYQYTLQAVGYLYNEYTSYSHVIGGRPISETFPYGENNNNYIFEQSTVDNSDFAPDVYSFNFCGYSGKFTIGNDHKAVIIEGDIVDVDFSNLGYHLDQMAVSDPMTAFPTVSSIVITTQDGYKYTFGGSLAALEYSRSLDNYVSNRLMLMSMSFLSKLVDDIVSSKPFVTSWYLTDIEAPNHRHVRFSYQSNNNAWMYDETPVNPGIHDYGNSSGNYSSSITKQVVLSSINVYDAPNHNVLTVSFHNAYMANHLYKFSLNDINGIYGRYDSFRNIRAMQLNSITVSTNTDQLRSIQLSYEPICSSSGIGSFYRYMLTGVNIGGIGSYRMNYKMDIGSPVALNHPSGYCRNDRENEYGYALGDTVLWGLLSKIEYPTGGYQTFVYDTLRTVNTKYYYWAEQYNSRVDTANNYKKSTGQLGVFHGVNLKKIYSYTAADRKLKTSEFSYSDGTYFDSRLHCGTQGYGEPRKVGWQYNHGQLFGYGSVSELITYFDQNADLPPRPLHAPPGIGDSPIQDVNLDLPIVSKTLIKYKYCVADDDYIASRGLVTVGPAPYNNSSGTYCTSGLVFSKSEMASRIGKLLEKTISESAGDTFSPVRKETYTWSGGSQQTTTLRDTIAIFEYSPAFVSRRFVISPVRMTSQVVKEYADGDSISHACSYVYDSRNRIKVERKSDNRSSGPRMLFKKYIYPDYLFTRTPSQTGYSNGIQYLVLTNQIASPIECVSGYEVMENGMVSYITTGELCLLSYAGPPMQRTYTKKIYSLQISNPIRESNFQHITYNSAINQTPNSSFKPVCTQTFDSDMRIHTNTPEGGLTTTYTWLNNYLSSIQEGDQITTFEFKPYVGMTRMTDQRGVETNYEYDAIGRLIEISTLDENDQKEILQSYQYHYANP